MELTAVPQQPQEAPVTLPEESPAAVEIEETEPEILSASLQFAGDITVSKSILETVDDGTSYYDFSGLFENLGGLFSESELALAVLETLTDDEVTFSTYNAPPDLLDSINGAGIHYLSLATEHAFDLGYAGLQITRSELTSRGINFGGAARTDITEASPLLSLNGIQFAILPYTYGFSEDGLAASSEEDRAVVPVLDRQRVATDIASVRAAGADVVILLPHWGIKNSGEVTEGMREFARAMAAAGADLIIGSHSNVVSEMEIIETERADGRSYETLVCYSLGALMVDARSEENAAGAVLSVDIEFNRQTRRIMYRSRQVTPVYIYQDATGGKRVWRVLNVTNEAMLERLPDDLRDGALEAGERVGSLVGWLGKE